MPDTTDADATDSGARGARGLRIVAAVVGGVLGIPYALLVTVVVSSRLTDADPHGYALIAGTAALLPLGLALALVVPLMASSRRRTVVRRVALLAWIGVSAVIVALLLTA